MPEVPLPGCTPVPLLSYLKGLGVLRLVAEQKDPAVRAAWRDDSFILASSLDADALVRYFVDEYRPSPLVAPWNGGSGFYAGDVDARGAVEAIVRDGSGRFAAYTRAIDVARQIVAEMGLTSKPDGDRKAEMLRRCRARLPEDAVRWLDATVVLAGDAPRFPPLLGTGGNDGRLEFSKNFMRHLVTLLIERRDPEERLRAALFEKPYPAMVRASPGQFLPSGVEAPNAGEGFRAAAGVNPWDFVLAVEGTLVLTPSVARRFGSGYDTGGRTLAAFPFTVSSTPSGHPSAAAEASHGEVWLPLWGRPATAAELQHLFSEGRAQWRRRQATRGVDFARAAVSLGVDRGVREFRRFGLQQRSGNAYLATPLGRVRVVQRPDTDLLEEADAWLDRLRRTAAGKEAPGRLREAVRRIDGAILDYCARGGPRRLLDVLEALAEAERGLARGVADPRSAVAPLFGLSPRWVEACDDGSHEFELAASLASIRGHPDGRPGPFRCHLEPVTLIGGRFAWEEQSRSVVWSGRDAIRDMGDVLERRLVETDMSGVNAPPLAGRVGASLDAVAALLDGRVDLGRLAELVWALAVVDWHRARARLRERPVAADPALPAEYPLLKLLFLGAPMRLPRVGEEVELGADARLVSLLRRGDVAAAVAHGMRRLRAAGVMDHWGSRFVALRDRPRSDPARGRVLLAALLFPVDPRRLAGLAIPLPAGSVQPIPTEGREER